MFLERERVRERVNLFVEIIVRKSRSEIIVVIIVICCFELDDDGGIVLVVYIFC